MTAARSHRSSTQPRLVRYAWLSVGAAVVTMGLKFGAWAVTGSVGLLSDALESTVNLTAALVAVLALIVAARPPDESHPYGHGKVEYFSAGLEGLMILVAATLIVVTAVDRLIHPQEPERLGIGLAVAVLAALVNLGVALVLRGAGTRHRSITLVADSKHLLTDVWTTGGVVLAVLLVGLTGWDVLDPLVALAVGANIVVAGVGLLRRSTRGLMDAALPEAERRAVDRVLATYEADGVQFHAIRTRESGSRRFVSLHVLVPGSWSVQRGHDLVGRVERGLHEALPGSTVFTHLEPVEDPSSWDDETGTQP